MAIEQHEVEIPAERQKPIQSQVVSAEIAASFIRGRRSSLLIVPETRRALELRGAVALLEPHRIDVDAEHGLTVAYQAFGTGQGWKPSSQMPEAASRLTFLVRKIERLPVLIPENIILADGIYDTDEGYAWQSTADVPRVFETPMAAWWASSRNNWPASPSGPFIALHGALIRGNLCLMREAGDIR